MFKSATFKLTMWYLAIVMILSIIFSGALYNVASDELHRSVARESERIQLQFPVFNDDPRLDQINSDVTSGEHRILLRLIALNIFVFVGAGYASYLLARRTLEPIEQAHEQQKRFTSDVSHELRTPLTALRMESEVALLNDKSSASDLRKTIESNLEEISKIDKLINNLLKLSRLEADELQQNFTKVSSKQVFDEALSQVKKQAKSRNITIEEKIHDSTILGDKDSLTQLLIILMDNAIKYSPDKSTLFVSSNKVKDEIAWTIKDQGKGISKEALDHVFDRFYRADTSRNKSHQDGYGLGLSIAKMIADIHSATIVLKSRVGAGTEATVYFSIPPKK